MIREEFTNLVLDRKDLLSLYDGGFNLLPSGQNKILSLITTEIEKVELPKYKKSWTSDGEKFEDCLAPVAPEDTRQSILNLLKEQK